MKFFPSIDKVIILLEWAGAFLLAVEAIKIRNLIFIRNRVDFMSISIGKMFRVLMEMKDETVEVDSKNPKDLAKVLVPVATLFLYFLLGFVALAIPLRIYVPNPETQLRFMFDNSFLGSVAFFFWAALAMFLAFLAGACIYWCLARLFDLVFLVLSAIERNVANGIVGIMGFVLFSLASILKLLVGHY